MPRDNNLFARGEGWDAAEVGQSIADNPYPPGPGAAESGDWRQGFMDYHRDLMVLLQEEAQHIEDRANEAAEAEQPE